MMVFINIDWKSSRHRTVNARNRNAKKLRDTIGSVVRNMQPTILCMCEVGTPTDLLSQDQTKEVERIVMGAWTGAAKNVKLRSLFSVEAPYMTIYNCKEIACSDHSMMNELYDANGQ